MNPATNCSLIYSHNDNTLLVHEALMQFLREFMNFYLNACYLLNILIMCAPLYYSYMSVTRMALVYASSLLNGMLVGLYLYCNR